VSTEVDAQVQSYLDQAEPLISSGSPEDRSYLANQLSLFEVQHRGDLAAWQVDQLDAAIDHLRNGMPSGASPEQSSLMAGLKSWWNDEGETGGGITGDALKRFKEKVIDPNIPTPPGGWTPWLIGAGLVVLLIAVGYSSRGVKELVKG